MFASGAQGESIIAKLVEIDIDSQLLEMKILAQQYLTLRWRQLIGTNRQLYISDLFQERLQLYCSTFLRIRSILCDDNPVGALPMVHDHDGIDMRSATLNSHRKAGDCEHR